ncbi:polyprenyl synthetase family protein [Aquirufa antheringensis]|jgi:geranylgeranyl diphosphate synthase type II|uniref:Polyprenyl synthetase family protein n=1 Tax=Aquirufa antheringensis TaxID=2516559 RepID=A0A4Q9BI82_9BACT|nr:polyprenyl synthetase family protein [Aquirufa antheringensis]MCZ2485270.1 polyprenyl synthetase family protein [Aquirufa antheringensis]MCZ2487455.1 polyprenyl synthetase family protein [Aquirufa antheringensis]MCZ2490419.1 polyprenyl synthetase family protein [Aquirufa antheringensis]TBH75571.1 polyprenyl synthetase family protein [Aquirufa antheringensis]
MNKAFLAALEEEIRCLDIGQNPSELYDPIHYLLSLGGKRIRPVLCLLTYSLFKSDWEKQVPAALSVEIFHNFTLMHDDIMDKAPLRRGKQTVHEKWNDNIAILSGDVMLVNAYQYLNKVKGLSLEAFQHLLGRLSRIAAEVCEGQQFDMNFESRGDVSVEEYIEMIRLKTSVLIGFSMEMGGLLASAPAEVSDSLYRIGETIGLGFQLKDDLLDVYGDPEKFGKQPGGDILANKKTYLLIKAFEKATGSTLALLEKWVAATEYDASEKVQAVTAIYDSLGLKAETEAVIASYFDAAFLEIQSLAISEEQKSALVKFMSGLVDREV